MWKSLFSDVYELPDSKGKFEMAESECAVYAATYNLVTNVASNVSEQTGGVWSMKSRAGRNRLFRFSL